MPSLRRTRSLAANDRLDLRVHPRFADDDLARYLAGLDVFVLPYRFGTHSGWLEACRDTGTRVVAPTCGFYRDQWDQVIEYRNDERTGLDEAGLAAAVTRALRLPPLAPAGRDVIRGFMRGVAAQVPTLREAGLTGVTMPGWYAFVGPAGMPTPAVERLNAATRAVVDSPAVTQRLREAVFSLSARRQSPEPSPDSGLAMSLE